MVLLPLLLYLFTPVTLVYVYYARNLRNSRSRQVEGITKHLGLDSTAGKKFVGFFHPYW
jgi:hypothetical protein